jgi:hypothetical protein
VVTVSAFSTAARPAAPTGVSKASDTGRPTPATTWLSGVTLTPLIFAAAAVRKVRAVLVRRPAASRAVARTVYEVPGVIVRSEVQVCRAGSRTPVTATGVTPSEAWPCGVTVTSARVRGVRAGMRELGERFTGVLVLVGRGDE